MWETFAALRGGWGWVVEALLLVGGAVAFVVWARGGVKPVLAACAWYAVARAAGTEGLALLGLAAGFYYVRERRKARASAAARPPVEEIASAAAELSRRRTGAIIAIERKIQLSDYLASGTRIEALARRDVLRALFGDGSPLRNGAAIVRGHRIEAAGCLLPLSENPDVSKNLGTRHRAALGASERTDAVAVVVSAETGAISVAIKGDLMQGLSTDDLRRLLSDLWEA